MYNKNNLTNIYKYDPKLIDKINQKIQIYDTYNGFTKGYKYLIEQINENFIFFKKEHTPIIYHLTDRVFRDTTLNTISHYADAIFKASKHNDYSALLDFVKYEDNNLYKYFERLKSSNNIYDRYELESEIAYDLKADPYDTDAEEIRNNLEKTTSDYLQVKNDNSIIEFEDEEEVLKKLYKLEYEKFNQVFFDNLDLLWMENPNYREIEEEMEM